VQQTNKKKREKNIERNYERFEGKNGSFITSFLLKKEDEELIIIFITRDSNPRSQKFPQTSTIHQLTWTTNKTQIAHYFK
jgi:hypothetical protein